MKSLKNAIPILIFLFSSFIGYSQNHEWSINMGGSGNDFGRHITTDNQENVYVTGFFTNTSDFNPSSNSTNLVSNGGEDIFIAKYDSLGNLKWAHGIGSSGKDRGKTIVLDNDGNLLLSGFFEGSADFDPSSSTQTLTSQGGEDIFLTKWDTSGNLIWAKGTGGSGNDRERDMDIDPLGNIYLTGFFSGTADLDPSSNSNTISSNGQRDIFISKYDNAGNFLWGHGMGASSIDIGFGLAVDSSGNAYGFGIFEGTVDFDPSSSSSSHTSNGQRDIFIVKFDSTGTFGWSKGIGGVNSDWAGGIALDPSGSIYLTGNYQSTVNFAPSGNATYLSSNGAKDIFIAKYDTAGNYQWAKSIGGSSDDQGADIIYDGYSYVYLTGYFQNSVDFDPSNNSSYLTSEGNEDAFFAKFENSGQYISAFNAGSNQYDKGNFISLSGNTHYVVTGKFKDTVDLDPSTNTSFLGSNGGDDIFLAKYKVDHVGVLNKDHQAKMPIQVYPNPCKDLVSISFTSKQNTTSKIELINQLGQTVWEKKEKARFGKNLFQYNLSNLNKGAYYLKISINERPTKAKMLFIN